MHACLLLHAGARRYDDNYKLETDRRSSRDDKKAEDPSNDEEGFDRDMRTLFVAHIPGNMIISWCVPNC